jgi:hypothetical protein
MATIQNFSGLSGMLGATVAMVVLSLLAVNAKREAITINDRRVLKYGLPVHFLSWTIFLLGLFFVYAASKASADQHVLAWCTASVLFCISAILPLEVCFVGISFDDDFIYTFSPWRPHRKIPWSGICGYSYSHLNRWHILKTTSHGNIRLSILLSGLGTFSNELKKRNLPGF